MQNNMSTYVAMNFIYAPQKYECMYECTNVCMYVYMYVCIYIYVCITLWVYVCMYISGIESMHCIIYYIYIYVLHVLYVFMYVCMHINCSVSFEEKNVFNVES